MKGTVNAIADQQVARGANLMLMPPRYSSSGVSWLQPLPESVRSALIGHGIRSG